MALMHSCKPPTSQMLLVVLTAACSKLSHTQCPLLSLLFCQHQVMVLLDLRNCQFLGQHCQSLSQPCPISASKRGLSCALQASQAVLSMPLVVTDWSVSPSDAVAPTPVDSTGRVLFARQGPDADSLKNVQQHKSDAIERRHKSSLKVRTHLACMAHGTHFCPALKLWPQSCFRECLEVGQGTDVSACHCAVLYQARCLCRSKVRWL